VFNCAVPENIHTSPYPRRDWNFLGGGGFCETKKKLKKCMRLNSNFHRGAGS